MMPIMMLSKLITENKIGLIFFQGPVRQANLTNRYQSKNTLFIGIDAEWGLSMRLDSTYTYPWNMTLGAVQDMNLIEKLGAQMGEQSKRGLQFNFAPVLDINTNPKILLSVSVLLEKTSIKLQTSNSVNERYAGKGCFPQGNIFLVTGIPTQTPTKDCPRSAFLSKG
jgi:hypothetical protein